MWNNTFNKCEVKKCETYGSYVTASQNIRAGEVLLQDEPVVVMPHWDSKVLCSNCYKECMTTCKNCKIFPLCTDCTMHYSFDCNFFKKLINEKKSFNENLLIENFNAYGPLKCLLMIENSLDNDKNNDNDATAEGLIGKRFLALEDHQMERRKTNIWNLRKEYVCNPILKSKICNYFQHLTNINEDLLQKICGILDINAFELRTPKSYVENGGGTSLKGLFLHAALLSHNCMANTMISVDDEFKMKIIASIDIQQNEIVSNNYTNPLLGTAERQQILKVGKYFECNCKRCNDPTELGTYLSAIHCTECQQNDCYILYQNLNKIWKTSKCGKIFDNIQINEILLKFNQDLKDAGQDLHKLELMITKYEKILNPKHFLLIDLKQNVASILRTIYMNTDDGSKPIRLLQRKLKLCNEILDVLKILQPGISRLRAITLYETFTPFIELTEYEFENKQITLDEYVIKLKNAEKILKEASDILVYEPFDTPEGQLARRAMMELKELRDSIKEITKHQNILNDENPIEGGNTEGSTQNFEEVMI